MDIVWLIYILFGRVIHYILIWLIIITLPKLIFTNIYTKKRVFCNTNRFSKITKFCIFTLKYIYYIFAIIFIRIIKSYRSPIESMIALYLNLIIFLVLLLSLNILKLSLTLSLGLWDALLFSPLLLTTLNLLLNRNYWSIQKQTSPSIFSFL